tara:strand:+ start:229 stop:570 length:342 start_codon:yes stop_codon:yes gene_type:complete
MKSPQAFRTISEVSNETNIPTHVLRFWETKFSNINPLKRSGNRRYYRPEDVKTIIQIKTLLYENGYTVKGVQKLLQDKSNKIQGPKEGNNKLNSIKNRLNFILDDIENLIKKI